MADNVQKIFQGISGVINVKLERQNAAKDPVNLTSATTITACFSRGDTSAKLQITFDSAGASGISITGGTLGKFEINYSASQASVMLEGLRDFGGKYTISTGEEAYTVTNLIQVVADPC